jgi:hypothetical protein
MQGAPIGAPPPFFLFGRQKLSWRWWQGLRGKARMRMHRENALLVCWLYSFVIAGLDPAIHAEKPLSYALP